MSLSRDVGILIGHTMHNVQRPATWVRPFSFELAEDALVFLTSSIQL